MELIPDSSVSFHYIFEEKAKHANGVFESSNSNEKVNLLYNLASCEVHNNFFTPIVTILMVLETVFFYIKTRLRLTQS